MDKPKTITPESLASRIREYVVTERIMPATHYMVISTAMWHILVCAVDYAENINPIITAYPTAQYAGAIHGVWVLVDDKADGLTIKPIAILG